MSTKNGPYEKIGGVDEFVAAIPDEAVRKDCETLTRLMREATGDQGNIWARSIAGFGDYRIKYADGHEEDWFPLGFSPRKQNLTIYTAGFDDQQDLLAKLGPHSTGKGCLYIKRLDKIDLKVLEKILHRGAKKTHGNSGMS